jgi:DNA-binding CsgD family transcriptional regulator
MKPQGLALLWPLNHALATEAGDPVGLITIFRAEGQDPFTEEECSEAEQYVPHLRRAVAIREEFQNAQRTRLALAEVMDRLPMGMLLLDDARQVVIQNQAAERIVEREDGLCVDRGGPSVANARENAALQTLIADAIEGKIGRAFGSRGFLSITRRPEKRPLSVMITSLTGMARGSPAGDAVVAVFISDPELQRLSGPKALAKLYGLTQSEAEILQLLSMGMSLEAAAASRGVSMNTARSHIKHVFAKTGVSRQGELMRLICSGVGSVRQE